MSSSDRYREKVMEHDRNPRNKRWIQHPDFESHGSNPVCGDDIMIQVRLNKKTIEDIAFSGRGCAISQATASMLTELAKGKPIEWAAKSSEEEIFGSLGLGEHRRSRVSCELLGIRALKNGVLNYRGDAST
jgi:nitrogen fixation NifU-like protein